tara:strand:+ start:174 stop:836 length:663 start_codon:yes stop_codon:yes gene_type:complete
LKITNEDNMKLMSRYEDNHFELAIVDPPYGIDAGKVVDYKCEGKRKQKYSTTKHIPKEWDNSIPNKDYFKELKRVSKNQIIFGANYFTEHLSSSKGWVVWDKKIGDNNFSMAELIFTSLKKPLKIVSIFHGANRISNNEELAKANAKIHPTQKPLQLYEWLLMNYAKEGDKILDTHLGSGSIAIACHNLKYDLTACELDKEYFESAMKRLEQHKSQLRLL